MARCAERWWRYRRCCACFATGATLFGVLNAILMLVVPSVELSRYAGGCSEDDLQWAVDCVENLGYPSGDICSVSRTALACVPPCACASREGKELMKKNQDLVNARPPPKTSCVLTCGIGWYLPDVSAALLIVFGCVNFVFELPSAILTWCKVKDPG
jgi:hypothetical protein